MHNINVQASTYSHMKLVGLQTTDCPPYRLSQRRRPKHERPVYYCSHTCAPKHTDRQTDSRTDTTTQAININGRAGIRPLMRLASLCGVVVVVPGSDGRPAAIHISLLSKIEREYGVGQLVYMLDASRDEWHLLSGNDATRMHVC